MSSRVRAPVPAAKKAVAKAAGLYVHVPKGRRGRQIDETTEKFVDSTR